MSENDQALLPWINAETERAFYISLRARAEAEEGNHEEAEKLRDEYDVVYDGIFAALDANEGEQ